MVWLHGGGFTTGTGSSALFAGGRLAAKGVVVVTINYRLGALGLLAHPDLVNGDDPGWGNWSLRDQIAALEWVRENIAAFGGDPGNVTLFGESAGAMSISDLLTAPRRVRALSSCGHPERAAGHGQPAAGRRRRAERLAGHLGIPADAVATLRDVPAERLVEATQRLAVEAPSDGGLPLALLPVVDGVLLERPPGEHDRRGLGGAAVPGPPRNHS